MLRNYNAVVLSGLPGAGKSSLVRALSEETGWPIHSIGDIMRTRLAQLQESREVSKDLTIKNWWPTLSNEEQIKVNDDLLEIVNRGEVLADTRYAFYLKQATSNPLFVFLMADSSVRARRKSIQPDQEYHGKCLGEVARILTSREEDEVRIGINLFGRDYRNPGDYGLILDSGKISIEEEVSKIAEYLSVNAH